MALPRPTPLMALCHPNPCLSRRHLTRPTLTASLTVGILLKFALNSLRSPHFATMMLWMLPPSRGPVILHIEPMLRLMRLYLFSIALLPPSEASPLPPSEASLSRTLQDGYACAPSRNPAPSAPSLRYSSAPVLSVHESPILPCARVRVRAFPIVLCTCVRARLFLVHESPMLHCACVRA
ncbi:hypothetical protein C8F01DRAFT_1261864 [Mycena amicta]|nr:hypothetical protein C8F01DRAFT_1261864 [Mycena amicta]